MISVQSAPKVFRVLGLDPGTRRFGWGVVERCGTRLRHVDHGVIEEGLEGPLGPRLVIIEKRLDEAIRTYQPDAVAIETLFFAKDPQAASKLGHARAIGLLVAARAGLPIGEYQPTLIKKVIVGSGRAEKEQIARMVKALLALQELTLLDASDALAIAITHLNAPVTTAPALATAMAKAKASRPRRK